MKSFPLLFTLFSLILIFVQCKQDPPKDPFPADGTEAFFQTNLAPFYHGVASGDPLPDRVIIWTRVTPEYLEAIELDWKVSSTKDFSEIIQSGKIKTNQNKDFTVKVDVTGLSPNTFYYYQFSSGAKKSPIGRTRTAPSNEDANINFIVASCSNYEWGYFNAFGRIAEKEDINAVLHLGDYIYEYSTGTYGDTTIGRKHLPVNEIITLQDYRTRYAEYRLDKDFQAAHQKHPFITIWDDHEITNDSHVSGAENHQPEEGDYEDRKNAARQAYFEWLPVRNNEGQKIYRNFSFGSLVDLIMLDERIEGRSPQVDSLKHPDYLDESRSMLGKEQLDWFIDKITSSKASWKIIGNQVIFSDLNMSPAFPKKPLNLDAWDGYPIEKRKILQTLKQSEINNVVFVTGDSHCSWAFEVPLSTENYMADENATLAVELGSPSITSSNYDEYTTLDTVKMVEQWYQHPKLNPHLKYVNLHEHGYIQLSLNAKEALAEWYFVESIRESNTKERLARRISIPLNQSKLVLSE